MKSRFILKGVHSKRVITSNSSECFVRAGPSATVLCRWQLSLFQNLVPNVMEDKRRAYFLATLFALSLRCVRSGGCEEHALGLADGYIVDSQLTASSVLNSNTPAKNCRLNYTAGSSWCASTSDRTPYLQINLHTLYIICAVSTQGNSQGDQWVQTYTLQSSTDGTTWTDYEERGQTKVFLGNFDTKSTAKRALFSELSTRYLRVVARDNHGGVCMRIELYGEQQIQGNIALFMPTNQSTTHGSAIASRAVDGVKDGHYSHCTYTQASGSSNPWWRVDLRRVQPVAEVRILNRGDCCADRLDGAEIRVGNDTRNGGASNHLCATITRIPAGKQKYFHCNPTARGRYVYIRIPGNSKILTVCEVEVYSFLPDLALNQPAQQIDTDAGGVASRAVDGGTSTEWGDGSCTHTTETTDPWWRVDLGSSVAVAEVRIVNRACSGGCGSRLSSFEIRIGNLRENNGGTSNSRCGNLHSLNSGESKSIYCVPRIVGRYVYIRIPGINKVLTLCEVEVYSRKRVDGNACNNQPVGLEDRSKIPDYRFTASSNRVNNPPSSGRLKGSVAWVPSSTNNTNDFLQIDLGSVYAVCSVATQGAPNADEWTTTYKIKISLDNSNWTTYAENNADKVFDGNNDRISIIRNDLLHPTFAQFIRFYPMTFNGHKALRVEVYGSPEGCQSPLGLEDRRIQYSQISASSKIDPNHAANFSRLYSSSSWCSSAASSSEYLQVDLGETTAVTGIATQGDHSVDKWVTRYLVQFGADSYTRFFRYLNFQGNQDRNLPYVNWFSEPVETSVVRIVPLSWKTSVCLRLELYGCVLLLKVPKPTINNFQDVNLQPAKGSFVNLRCNASSGVEGMTVAFRWAKDGNDISTLSSAVSTQGKFVLSTLRVNFTKAEDIVSSYNCTRESEASRTVDCQKTFVCYAFYSSLALRLAPTYQTAVVTVKLRVPDAVKQITVDTIVGTSAVIRWQKLPAGGEDEVGIAGYQVWYVKQSIPNSANFVNATENATLVLDNLTRNTTYKVKVRAISALGFGLWSSTVNFRTARTVTCEEKIVGPETGFTPDMVTSSSKYNSSTSSSHSVMSYAVDFPWCASLNDTSPYLEIDLGDVFMICALSTRGDPHDGEHWVESYTLETSLDRKTWTDYKEGDQQRTFLGNYDSATVVKEELYSGMVCQKVRLRVKTYHGLPCLKLQLFGVKQSCGNLALNRPTDQIDTDSGGVASRAVDGGTSTDWGQNSCTHTTTTTDPWWRVDLGFSVAVAEVRIVNRACSGGCGSRLSAFEIRIGNSTSGGGSSNQLCRDNLQVSSGKKKSFYCDPPIYGRYVYIRIPGSGKTLTLCEVEVYSTPRKNVALNKQTRQSSTNNGGDSPRAVDGRTSTDWGQGSCTHTNTESNPWWRVDLGSPLLVGEVFVVNRACSGGCGERLKGFQIWIGNINETNDGGTSNSRCGDLHSLNSGESKSIYCVPRIVGRYVYIRIPGNNKVLTLCEVEVYSRRRVDGNAVCVTQPVGAEDSFSDHRFSASSFKAGKEPSKGRLNGGYAWIPSTNGNNSDFLEIDLGSVYFICGVVTQGNPTANEWTTEFKLKTSLNNKNWTTYEENGIEKVFAGNTDRSSLRRNSLIRATLTKFIRFYPISYSTSKALRVEIYGYAQGSKTPLGLENGDLTDSQLTASSNPAAVRNGRLYNQSAWCSSPILSTEYFQVDLGNVRTITGVATQGDPSSDKWVKTYTVSYSYTGQHWTQYKGHLQQPELLKGNDNRNSVQANWMKQPFVARYLRIFAKTWNSGICLRIDGYGSTLVNAPIIRPPLVDKTLKKTVGNSVILSCVVYGRAHVAVTWMINGQELTNPSDITFDIVLGNNWEKTESNLTLTYRNASYAKTLFQCTRVSQETRILRCKKLSVTCNANYFGTLLGSSSAASVSLVDNLFLPEAPPQPVFSNIKSTSAVVAWNDTDSGDSPILFYRVLYNTSSLSMNQTTLTRSINITSLQPYTDYTFEVQAISAIGDGPVSRVAHLKTYLPSNISTPPTSVNKKLGLRVTFNCTVIGFPRPTLLWTKDNITLDISNGTEIVKQEDSDKIESFTSLTIVQAKRSNTGVYVCQAYNSAGTTSKAANLTVLEKPDKLRANIDSVTAGTVKLSWTVSFDGNSPVLFYTVAHNISNGTLSYNVSSNESSLVMNLNPAKFYEFTITATNQIGTSDLVVISTLEAVPDAPRFVRAIVTGSRSIFLNWTIPAVTNGKLIKYVVYCDTTEGYGDNTTVRMNQTLLPNTTSLVIESLVPFTYYTFQVQAFTNIGGGHRSDPTGRVRTHEDAPSKPQNLQFTINKPGEDTRPRMTVTWGKPAEENGIIKRYTLAYSYNYDGKVMSSQHFRDDRTLSYSFDVLGGLNYTVTVRAETIKPGPNATGTPQVPEYRPSIAPQNITSQKINETTYKISWDPLSREKSNGLVIAYEVERNGVARSGNARARCSEGVVLQNTTEPFAVLHGLTSYSTFKVKVRAYTSAGPGDFSSLPYDIATSTPGPPSDVRTENAKKRTVILRWNKPALHGKDVQKYTVIYDGKKGYYPDFRHTGELETTSLTLTVQNLYPGTKYNFVIIATTHCASGENSSVVSSQTLKDVPLPPVPHEPAPDLTVTDLPANVTVWAAPQNNGPISHYQVLVHLVKESTDTVTDWTKLGTDLYIAAQIPSGDVNPSLVFALGDGKEYGGFVNKELSSGQKYNIYSRALTVKSKKRSVEAQFLIGRASLIAKIEVKRDKDAQSENRADHNCESCTNSGCNKMLCLVSNIVLATLLILSVGWNVYLYRARRNSNVGKKYSANEEKREATMKKQVIDNVQPPDSNYMELQPTKPSHVTDQQCMNTMSEYQPLSKRKGKNLNPSVVYENANVQLRPVTNNHEADVYEEINA